MSEGVRERVSVWAWGCVGEVGGGSLRWCAGVFGMGDSALLAWEPLLPPQQLPWHGSGFKISPSWQFYKVFLHREQQRLGIQPHCHLDSLSAGSKPTCTPPWISSQNTKDSSWGHCPRHQPPAEDRKDLTLETATDPAGLRALLWTYQCHHYCAATTAPELSALLHLQGSGPQSRTCTEGQGDVCSLLPWTY